MSRLETALLRSGPWRAAAVRAILPWALDGAAVEGRALEVGCGSGAMAAELLRRTPSLELTATDFDPVMVGAARRRLGGLARVEQADATALPFADDSFDVALSFLMLHHTGAWERALRELVRVVRPGGLVLGCDVLRTAPLDWAEHVFGTGEERLIPLDELRPQLDALGLAAWTVTRTRLPLLFRFALRV